MSDNSNEQEQQFYEKVKENQQTPNKQQNEEQEIPTEKKQPFTYIPENKENNENKDDSKKDDYYSQYLKSLYESRQKSQELEIELAKSRYLQSSTYYPHTYSSYYYHYTPASYYDYPYYLSDYPYSLRSTHADLLTKDNINNRERILNIENNINKAQAENNLLINSNAELEQKINQQISLQEEAQKKHFEGLNKQESEFQDQLNNLYNKATEEQNDLNNQIKQLQDLIDQNRSILDEEKNYSLRLISDLNSNERQLQEKSIEAQFWKNRNDDEIQKFNFENENHNQLLEQLKQNQESEIQSQEQQKDLLNKIILARQQDIENAKANHEQTLQDLANTQIEKRNKDIEAELNRRKAEEIEIKKNAELNLKESINQAEKYRILREAASERILLDSQIRDLSHSALQKEIEASAWRNNYARLNSSVYPYVPAYYTPYYY